MAAFNGLVAIIHHRQSKHSIAGAFHGNRWCIHQIGVDVLGTAFEALSVKTLPFFAQIAQPDY